MKHDIFEGVGAYKIEGDWVILKPVQVIYKDRIITKTIEKKPKQYKYKREPISKESSLLFPNNKCELCGWEGVCDRHRKISGKNGGKYTKDNVIVVCPNCHRMIHLGVIKI